MPPLSIPMDVEEPPPGNHLFPSQMVSRGRFPTSSPSRQSPTRTNRSSPLSVPPPSSTTPRKRRAKSPIPETTPTRLRQEISMTTGASPSILGQQRSRKPTSATDTSKSSSVVFGDESAASEDLPAINVNPASTPVSAPQEHLPIRHPSQPDAFYGYPGMPSYRTGDPSMAHIRHPSYESGYAHPPSPYLPAATLAPPPNPFMRTPSPGRGYLVPQRYGSGLVRGDYGFIDSDLSSTSDWVTQGYPEIGSAAPQEKAQEPIEHRQWTPSLPRPPLPPKPFDLQPSINGAPSSLPMQPSNDVGNVGNVGDHRSPPVVQPTASVPSTTVEDSFPPIIDNQTSFDSHQDAQEGLEISSQHDAATSPTPEARESPAVTTNPSPGAGGRPSKKSLGLIGQAFDEIMVIVEGLAVATGKPPSELYRRFERTRKGGSEGHLWNIYLHYFARHEKVESARVKKSMERNQAFRSLCYAQYKLDNPNFRELLETYNELEMAGTEMTVGQRKREVEKYEKKLQDLAMEANRTLDVDTFIITAGSIVLHDRGLVSFFETPNAVGFLSDKTDIQPDEAQAAFSAHVFNQKATDSLAFAREVNPPSPIIKAEAQPPSVLSTKNATQWLPLIKQCIYNLFQAHGVSISMSQFPWKLLLQILAQHGLVLLGYPPILMPGEVRGTNKTKAIGDLITTEQKTLARALGLAGSSGGQISLRRAPKGDLEAIQSGKKPVVVGQPPPPGSPHAKARQAYYSLTDKVPIYRRDGPSRLTSSKSSRHIVETASDSDEVIILSSPMVSKPTPAPSLSNDPDSDAESGAKRPKRILSKRKAVIDTASSADDDLYEDDPKPKRLKGGLVDRGVEKGVSIERAGKGSEASGRGKKKEVDDTRKGKGKEKGGAKATRSKKKSVAILGDTGSSDNEPSPARPKPRPAYKGSLKVAAPHANPAPSSPLAPPPIPADIVQDLPAAPAVAAPAKPTVTTPAKPTAAAPTKPAVAAPAVPYEAATPPLPLATVPIAEVSHRAANGQDARRHPLDGYGGFGEHQHPYQHAQPPHRPYAGQPPSRFYQGQGLPRYPGDGDTAPPERYGFQDYYGYAPSRDYYPPQYPPTMQAHVHPQFSAPPPGPYHQHSRREAYQQPNTLASGSGGLAASSSRLTPPSDRHA